MKKRNPSRNDKFFDVHKKRRRLFSSLNVKKGGSKLNNYQKNKEAYNNYLN